MGTLIRICITLACVVSATQVYADRPDFDHSKVPPLNNTTRAELRQWAAMYWVYYDTGSYPPEMDTFEFTHPEQFPPGFVYFLDADDLFETLFIHRLDLDPWSGTTYVLQDLIKEDEEVRNVYRHYTTTGVLATSLLQDSSPQLKKVQAAFDSLIEQKKYTIEETMNGGRDFRISETRTIKEPPLSTGSQTNSLSAFQIIVLTIGVAMFVFVTFRVARWVLPTRSPAQTQN